MTDEAHSLAVFIDFENLALGPTPRRGEGRRAKKTDVTVDMQRVLERLVEKGKIVAKRAYADWAGSQSTRRPCTSSASNSPRSPSAG